MELGILAAVSINGQIDNKIIGKIANKYDMIPSLTFICVKTFLIKINEIC